MDNMLVVFASCFAIVEAIIIPTKEIARKKMSVDLYTTIVQLVVGVLGIGFDIFFNNPTINFVYVIEAILMVGGLWLSTRLSFDEVKALLEAIKKSNRSFKA